MNNIDDLHHLTKKSLALPASDAEAPTITISPQRGKFVIDIKYYSNWNNGHVTQRDKREFNTLGEAAQAVVDICEGCK